MQKRTSVVGGGRDPVVDALLSNEREAVAHDVIMEFRRGWELEKMGAEQRQALIGRHYEQGETTRGFIDGVGQHVGAIDTAAYHFWGKKLGYQVWSDPNFLRAFLRDNPGARVKSDANRAQIVVPDSRFQKPETITTHP